MTIGLCVAHRLSRVSAPSEGMLQLRQGAPAVQPDPRLRVRDGGLSPGVLLPGGGQEAGGKNRRPAPPFPLCLPLRVESCEILAALRVWMFTAAEAVYSSDK